MKTKRLLTLFAIAILCLCINAQATVLQQSDQKYIVGSWIRTDTDEGKTTAIWTFKFYQDGTTNIEQATGFGSDGKALMHSMYKGTYYYNHLKKELIIYLDGNKDKATKFTIIVYTSSTIKLLFISDDGEKEYHVLNRVKSDK